MTAFSREYLCRHLQVRWQGHQPPGWSNQGHGERPYFAVRQVPECVSHSDRLPRVVRKLWLVVITQLPVSVRLKQAHGYTAGRE